MREVSPARSTLVRDQPRPRDARWSRKERELNDGWLTESFSRPRVHPRSVVRPPVLPSAPPRALRPFEEAKSFNLLIFHDETTTTTTRVRASPSFPSANFRICAVAVRVRPSVSQPSHFLLFEYLEDSEDGWTDGRTSCGGRGRRSSVPLQEKNEAEEGGNSSLESQFWRGRVRGGIRHERMGDSSAKAIK